MFMNRKVVAKVAVVVKVEDRHELDVVKMVVRYIPFELHQ